MSNFRLSGATQCLEDAIRDAALQATESVLFAASFDSLAVVVGTSFGAARDLSERDEVQHPIELSVTAPIEAMTIRTAGARWQGSRSVCHRELRLGAEALDVTDLGQNLGRGQCRNADDRRQVTRDRRNQRAKLSRELIDFDAQRP